MFYVDVLLPLSIAPLSFASDDETIGAGCFVAVPVGRKTYTGVVWCVLDERPNYKNIRTIERRLDIEPLTAQTMRFWGWIAEYYLAPLGDVMRVALPLAIKPSGFDRGEFDNSSYRPKMKSVVTLVAQNDEELNCHFESLARSAKQHAVMISIVELLGNDLFGGCVDRVNIGCGTALRALIKRGFIAIDSVEATTVDTHDIVADMPTLTDSQGEAYGQLCEGLKSLNAALLHGVTGSGKTEIYIHFIAQTIARGQSVLYLLPEIAITTQLIERLKRYFGARVTLYHSKLSDRERGEIYTRLSHSAGGDLIVGVRSAIFLPINNLGFVVVDEEHENSFKQIDPSPRYNARDAAMYLASIAGAKCLLGSATPSLESYANAKSGKYAFAHLAQRYAGAQMPKVIISDTLRAARRGEKYQHFNKVLLDALQTTLDEGHQAILFQNRRGFSPYVECDSCGWTATCPDCNVTLTYHSGQQLLKCHYCGHRMPMPSSCPSCGQGVPSPKGFGTEKIELILADIFPQARISRLDSDTATSRRGYERIVADFEEHRTDIIVGTQMITKGFDFANVSLVGILNADNLLNMADFRAWERAYALMMQVAGRAGRRGADAQVIIQTSQPTNPILHFVAKGDYDGMVRSQMAERESFFYPPYCRIINVVLRHRDKELLWSAADTLNTLMRPIFGRRLIGPEAPMVERIKGEMIVGFMLKIEREASSAKAKKLLKEVIASVKSEQRFKNVTIYCNVDPQ